MEAAHTAERLMARSHARIFTAIWDAVAATRAQRHRRHPPHPLGGIMTTTYITILASAVGNERDGFRTAYDWDGRHFTAKTQAIENGFRLRESDDFNVGVVTGGKLTSLWWMDHQVTETADTLAEIAREAGL